MMTIAFSARQGCVCGIQRVVNRYTSYGRIESLSIHIKFSRRDDGNDDDDVGGGDEQDDGDDDDDDDDLWWNRGFLSRLSKECSIQHTPLQDITFVNVLLDRPNNEELGRFFRDVLPLALAKKIDFMSCQILPVYIDMFLTSLILHNTVNHAKLRTLNFSGTQLDSSTVTAIAQLLSSCAKNNGNGNGPFLENLCLDDCSIDSTGFYLIWKALEGNTCLKELSLMGNEIHEISWEASRALGNFETLQNLKLKGNPLAATSEPAHPVSS